MANKNQIASLLEQIFSSSKNLKKDLDKNDPREKIEEDLNQLTLNFQDLKEIFFGMNAQENESLKREFGELLSGQEDMKTYVQDVRKILAEVQERIRTDKKVEEKINDNLPEDQQNETPQSLLQGFKGLIDKLSQINEKAGRR